jgi:hypothetical protein
MQLSELAPLFKLEERACAGDRIIDDGDEADRCYVLLQGHPRPHSHPDPNSNPKRRRYVLLQDNTLTLTYPKPQPSITLTKP